MKLSVRNLGLIEHAELDVRPLTVLIGENGTNKTWVAYSLYGLMRSLMGNGSPSLPIKHVLDDTAQSVLLRIQADNAAIASSLAQATSPDLFLERNFAQYFSEIPAARVILGNAHFIQQLLRLTEAASDVEVKLELSNLEYRLETAPVRILVETMAHGGAMLSTGNIANGYTSLVDSQDKLIDEAWWRGALASILEAWLHCISGNAFILPTERNTLVSAKDLRMDEFDKVVTIPVADYAKFIGNQRLFAAHGFEPEDEMPPRNLAQDLASLLESQILKGKISFTSVTDEIRVSFHPSDQVELPIHAASSLVRSLEGLILYLETAKPGDFIVIDELEMSAHPEAQLALMELVAMLVNRGLRVVMTTHSPYIVDHLNNLMAAARVAPERQGALAGHFHLKRTEAFLHADKVAAYHFALADGRVTVRDVLDREAESIDWRTFSRVTDELSNLYGRILDEKERE